MRYSKCCVRVLQMAPGEGRVGVGGARAVAGGRRHRAPQRGARRTAQVSATLPYFFYLHPRPSAAVGCCLCWTYF